MLEELREKVVSSAASGGRAPKEALVRLTVPYEARRTTAGRPPPSHDDVQRNEDPSAGGRSGNVSGHNPHVLLAVSSAQRALQPTPTGRKVKRKLGKRQEEILCIVGKGIERGAIAAKIWGLERRYRHGNLDVWMSKRKRREYERKYRQAQPLITQTLRALEKRGLVELVRHGKCVKEVHLTGEGRRIAQGLMETRKHADGRTSCGGSG